MVQSQFNNDEIPKPKAWRKPVLPANTATPPQVRLFIEDLLISTRDLSSEHARRIADRWTLGTGHELRSYQVGMFRHVFGIEEGWIIFKEVKMMAVRERPRYHNTAGFCKSIFSCYVVRSAANSDIITDVFVAGAAVIGILSVIATFMQIGTNARKSCCAIASVISFFLAFFAFLSILPDGSDEARVEEILRREYWQAFSGSHLAQKEL